MLMVFRPVKTMQLLLSVDVAIAVAAVATVDAIVVVGGGGAVDRNSSLEA